MDVVVMRCCHVEHKGEAWVLELRDDGATVRDSHGNGCGEFTREDTVGAFLMPSFSESIKQFRVPINEELWFFDVARDDLKRIKAYLDATVVEAGPEAIAAVKSKAIRDLLIGVGLAVVGVGLTLMSYLEAANNPEGGSYVVTYGLVAAGLLGAGRGAYGLLQHRKLQRLAQEAA